MNPTTYRKIASYVLLLSICFWWLPFSLLSNHATEAGHKAEVVSLLMGHLGDHYQLHFGTVVIPLPVLLYKVGHGWYSFSSARLYDQHDQTVSYQGFKLANGSILSEDGATIYDLSITKNVIAMLLSILLMMFIFIGLVRHMRKRNSYPKGLWVAPWFLVRFVRDNIARKNIGKAHYERFLPYLLTLFFYILFNNLLGLLPEGANVTGNLSITFTLAFFTLLITVWNGSSSYWRHIFMPPGVPLFMYPIMVPLELLSMVIKPAILGIRLFANMLAGHVTLLAVIGIIFMTGSILAPLVIVPISIGMILLKILVSFVQAYIFTLLSAIAFGNAIEQH